MGTSYTIAITGASGFIGGFLARQLGAQGHRVLAFGRRPAAQLPDGILYQAWDITRPFPFTAKENISAVIHCASSVSEWGTYPEMFNTNVRGTENVLKTFAGTDLFVYLSTASVYGTGGDKIMVCEDAPYPDSYLNHYSTAKMLAEQVVKTSSHPNRVILRPHIVYGPGDTTLLPRLLKARRFGFLPVVGNGQNRLSLTHVANLSLCVELLLGKSFGLEIFNVCDTLTDTVDSILANLRAAMHWRERIVHINPSLANVAASLLETVFNTLHVQTSPLLTRYVVEQMSHSFTLDTTKARTLLAYTPAIEYPEGFRQVHDWLARTG